MPSSMFSPPYTSMPGSSSPISPKNFLLTTKEQPIMAGVLQGERETPKLQSGTVPNPCTTAGAQSLTPLLIPNTSWQRPFADTARNCPKSKLLSVCTGRRKLYLGLNYGGALRPCFVGNTLGCLWPRARPQPINEGNTITTFPFSYFQHVCSGVDLRMGFF